MNTELIFLDMRKNSESRKAQEQIIEKLTRCGMGSYVVDSPSDTQELLYSLSNSINHNSTVILSIASEFYISAKQTVCEAFNLKPVPDSKIEGAIKRKYGNDCPDSLSVHARIPHGAVPFISEDGLFSGYTFSVNKHFVVVLPFDCERIEKMLDGGLNTFLNSVCWAENPDKLPMHIEVKKPQAAKPREEQTKAEAEESDADEETAKTPEKKELSVSEKAAALLLKSGKKVAIASTVSTSVINMAVRNIPNYDKAFVFTEFFCKRGINAPSTYAINLARGARTYNEKLSTAQLNPDENPDKPASETNYPKTDFGAAVTNIYSTAKNGRTKQFVYMAVAAEKKVYYRKLYSGPNEPSEELLKTAADCLLKMICGVIDSTISDMPDISVFDMPESEKSGGIKPAAVAAVENGAVLQKETKKPKKKRKLKIFLITAAVAVAVCIGIGICLRLFPSSVSASADSANAGKYSADKNTDNDSDEGRGGVDLYPGDDSIAALVSDADGTVPYSGIIPTSENSTASASYSVNSSKTTAYAAQSHTSNQIPVTQKQRSGSGIFTFTVYGYGHGVGMSQHGANEYAKYGYDYRWILSHYYPGTVLRTETPPSKLEWNGKMIDTREILSRVVESEMSSSSNIEALKAQAVAAYSYIMNHSEKVVGVASSKVPSAGARSRQAVNAVWGQYLSLADGSESHANTVFFAMSAGKTTSSENVWGTSIYYLRSGVDSSVDKNCSGYKTTAVFTSDQIKARAKSVLGLDLTGDPSGWISICSHDNAVNSNIGYVNSIRVGSREMTGNYFRANILDYDIRSHCFTVSYTPNYY